MKTKVNILLCLLLTLFMGLLVILIYRTYERKVEEILLITPFRPIENFVNITQLEEKNTEDYVLTYEVNETKSISVLNKNHDVVLKATNYLYGNVMNTTLLSGSFFTKKAQEEGRKIAVLNKKAAFDILGNLDSGDTEIKIDGEVYTVCGVLEDRDKTNKNIYIPLAVADGLSPPDTFMACVNKNEKNAKEEVINHLKDLSVTDKSYHFYKLDDFSRTIFTKFLFSIKCTGFVILFFYIVNGLGKIKEKITDIRILSQQYDMADVWKSGWRNFVSVVLKGIIMGSAAVFMLLLFLSGIEDFLFIKNIPLMMSYSYSASFSFLIDSINKLSVYTHFVFLGYIVTLGMLFISNLFIRTEEA